VRQSGKRQAPGLGRVQRAQAKKRTPVASEGITKRRLNFNKIKSKIIHLLRGHKRKDYVFESVKTGKQDDIERWDEEPDNKEPLMNELGVNRVISLIESQLDRNTALSQLSNEQIQRRMRRFHKKLSINLGCYRKRYDINFEDLDHVMEIVVNPIKNCYLRARSGKESEAISGMTQRVEKTTEKREEGGKFSWVPILGGGEKRE